MEKKNKFDFASKEAKTAYLNEIISFFQNERDEIIGFVAAEQILDFFLRSMGEHIYKKALNDAKKLIKTKIEDLEVDLDLLSG
ncbi:DUF2164 family protein [Candidatus Kaiserbacteria bacterium]|nr:DUF2164 family protein [Candidatus Kaiserbacteria bacterium]